MAPLNQNTSSYMPNSHSPVQTQFVMQKAKEELFVQNNMEYEQRLKTHLYQFEDDEKKNHSIEDSQVSERRSQAKYRETPVDEVGNTKMSQNKV